MHLRQTNKFGLLIDCNLKDEQKNQVPFSKDK